jgi:hypothetical protein
MSVLRLGDEGTVLVLLHLESKEVCQLAHHRLLVLRVDWRTGHCPVHTGQSGVPNRPLLQATRCPRIAQPTVSTSDRWLTGQSGAPPDSPVNYSRTPLRFPESSRFTAGQPGAPNTVRCSTGQFGVPSQRWCWLHIANSFPFLFFSFVVVSST